MVVNEICLEAHELCFEARNGLNGNLDYGFLGKILDLMQIEAEEQLEIIRKIKRVEQFLRDNRDLDKKSPKSKK